MHEKKAHEAREYLTNWVLQLHPMKSKVRRGIMIVEANVTYQINN